MSKPTKWALLASGKGTILAAMLEQGLRPDVVLIDEECDAATIAADAGVEVLVRLREGKFDWNTGICDPDRVAYTTKLAKGLKSRNIDLVIMAGFMTVLAPDMFASDNFGGRTLNIHPALLPAFKGMYAVRDALAAGVKITGSTIHLATEKLDDGPIIDQAPVRVKPDDDEATLHERIKVEERRLYADVVKRILAGEIDLDPMWEKWIQAQS